MVQQAILNRRKPCLDFFKNKIDTLLSFVVSLFMFNFFHRSPKITVDALTSMETVFQLTPIVKATQAFPDWFKTMPAPGIGSARQSSLEQTNMRRCYGFTELFRKSFILESWADTHLEITKKDWSAYVKAGNPPTFHSKTQHNNSFANFHFIKFESPWFLFEKTGIHFAFMDAMWHHEKYDFQVMLGVEEYQIQHSTNIFAKFPIKPKKYNVYLPAGLAMAHIIPLTDKKVEVKCHLVDEAELKKRQFHHISVYGLNGARALIKRNKDRTKSKCPFS